MKNTVNKKAGKKVTSYFRRQHRTVRKERTKGGKMIKNCKLCGCKMVWENPNLPRHYLESSCNIENWSVCRECMVEHCVSTNCYACEYGKYPDCRFIEIKKHYLHD
jgi:hypothetical protein